MDLGYIIDAPSFVQPDGHYKQLGNSEDQIKAAREMFPTYEQTGDYIGAMINRAGQRRYNQGR
jgi:hypothetical protein